MTPDIQVQSDPETATVRRAAVFTLGCRLNHAESSVMERGLAERGYAIVPFKERSDLVIINSCTVTARADADCRHAIRNYIRRNPRAFVAVVGCYSQTGYKTLADIKGVDLIVGNQDKLRVLDYVSLGKNPEPLVIRDRFEREDFTIDLIGQSDSHARANLKIQDGCDFICSFCIIPAARGRARARNLENLLGEARSLVAQGFTEIVLTGVNIGTYDAEGRDVTAVVEALAAIEGLKRIRISSIEPTTIPERLFDMMADPAHPLVPYLHIPLQSGSDKVLKLMKRRYTRDEYMDFIRLAAARVPGIGIGTDVMVGMPGESDEDFGLTEDLLRTLPIHYFHVFSYSERPGTPAVKMPEKVDEQTKQRRSAVLRRLSELKRLDFHKAHLGRTMEVLFESWDNGAWSGLTANFIRVSVAAPAPDREGGQELSRRILPVRLISIIGDDVEGELL